MMKTGDDHAEHQDDEGGVSLVDRSGCSGFVALALLATVQFGIAIVGLGVAVAAAVVVGRDRVGLSRRSSWPPLSAPVLRPRADPCSEYVFDLLPVNLDVRVRVDTSETDPALLSRGFATFSTDREVRAVPPPDGELRAVLLDIEGTIERAGSLPPGYEHPVGEAFTRRGSIPVEMWFDGTAYTVDLLTGWTA